MRAESGQLSLALGTRVTNPRWRPRRTQLDALGIAYELREYEVDLAMLALDRVCVSAGVRGMQMLLAPGDYVRATDARLGDIAR